MTYTLDQNELLAKFSQIRKYSEEICQPLATEDYVPQPILDVSPPKWHLAHTTWFFEQFVLKLHMNGYQDFDKQYAYLFNSYYNHMGERTLRAHRGFISRPTVDEVYSYRHHVTDHIIQLLQIGQSQELLHLIEIGINHEQQHQELLIYDIKYILGTQPLQPAYGKSFQLQPIAEKNEWKPINEGLYAIGADGSSYCFDNELGNHQVFVPGFSIRNTLVTNGEYLQFIDDGAYQNHDLWLSEAWDHIQQQGLIHPLYWKKQKDQWYEYTMNGLAPLDEKLPASHISYYEAAAFAEWSGHRLPTEFEWEVAADQIVWGSLWEWTASAYQPYPGFKKDPGALGEYNGKFMLNQQVLRGASVATPSGHSRKTYRNFFAAPSQWIFNGIRLVKN